MAIFGRKRRRKASAAPSLCEQTIAECSKMLLMGPETRQALLGALEYLRQACGASRVSVFENIQDPQDGLCVRYTFESIAPDVEPKIVNPTLRCFPYRRGFDRWAQLLPQGRVISGPVESLPDSERPFLQRCGIRSVLVLPIQVQNRWYGFVSFEDHLSERIWNAQEHRLLGIAAEMIGGHISRLRAEEELRQRNTQMSELLKRERNASMQLEAAMNQLLAQQEDLQIFNRELREARVAAEAASQSKSEFLSNMSHEIRTPLTAVLGWAEVLHSNALEAGWPDETVQAIRAIQRNGEHLLEIINGILDLSKIEAGKFQLKLMGCSPRTLVEEVTALMWVRSSAKGLSLTAEFAGPIPGTIRTDPTRLRQVLINLVGNAIKFTERGGVRVVARLLAEVNAEPMIQFEVFDTGIGMSPDQMSRLFQAFTQVDNSTTRPFQGTGLGLAISKRLIELLDGTITVESQLGKGSTFRVTVPTGPLEEGVSAEAPAASRVAPAASVPAGREGRLDCRILLAEDGPDNQRLISFVLTKAGAEVTVAANGRLAVEQAMAARDAGKPFDVILMDMQMPEMDGYGATSLLRLQGVRTPIIALTAHAMAGDRQRCLDAGCDEYATKPINRAALIEVIREQLARAAACLT